MKTLANATRHLAPQLVTAQRSVQRHTARPLSLRRDLLARLPATERGTPLPQHSAAPTAPAQPQARHDGTRRMTNLLAATERPAPGHYEQLAARPHSLSSEPPVTWQRRVRDLTVMAAALGIGLGVAISGIQVLARMMGH